MRMAIEPADQRDSAEVEMYWYVPRAWVAATNRPSQVITGRPRFTRNAEGITLLYSSRLMNGKRAKTSAATVHAAGATALTLKKTVAKEMLLGFQNSP